MNKNNLKSFAPQARKDFIAAVTVRAQQLGFTATGIEDATLNGDVLIINGVGWPARVSGQREKLKEKISQHGFAQTMEEVAYTWFNRFAALRYMELHDFLDHGHRVLSSRDDGLPELLRHASEVTLPGLNAAKVTEMQLAGNRDNELYKLLLVAQCNELSRSMPFLFERIDDETELLLPDNLLRTDSIIAKLVAGVPEDDWQEIEVIGWLYQFYISEKKDQVIGKVVKSEDIPAATQLFTPNWIVQYLVQNSVGRLWLMANPQSTLAQEWPYYITPAEQTPEVQAQLDALIQTRVREDGDTLNPESITVLDPACGSGHILVVAYDVLKAIYLERGYRVRDIPRLILEKNLYGMDIDDRAAQMAGFALLMKARTDDRRLFTATDDAGNLQPPKLNVLSLQESKGLSVDELATHLTPFKVQRATITALVETFEHAKTFGSLIQIPSDLSIQLEAVGAILRHVAKCGDLYAQAAAEDLLPFVEQAKLLGSRYDTAVENPPYMGAQFFNASVKSYLIKNHSGCDKDLFAAFISRSALFCKESGFVGIVTSFTWMFISSFEELRKEILRERTLASLVQLEYDAFEEAKAHLCTFVFHSQHIADYLASFIRLSDFKGAENQGPRTLEAISNRRCGWFYDTRSDNFWKIPGSPISYWLSEAAFNAFEKCKNVANFGRARIGMATGKNDLYVRLWHEVDFHNIGIGLTREAAASSGRKWFPYAKGGGFRRWYGNVDIVVNWKDDGKLLRNTMHPSGQRLWAHNFNLNEIYKPAVCWNVIASTINSFRYHENGFLFDSAAGLLQANVPEDSYALLGLLNSSVAAYLLPAINPTINLPPGYLEQMPSILSGDQELVSHLIELSKTDWNSIETSWGFKRPPHISRLDDKCSIATSWLQWRDLSESIRSIATRLETENNQHFIQAYGLESSLTPDVSESEITLLRADREKDSQRLISYAIGCMMGRYSLDEPGLIYAHAGNAGFEPGRYATFPADADGIVPITDELWFADDACSRIREFLRAVWGPDTLEENMAWLAESLGTKASETPDESIRRYIADKFFKDHLQTYKKRPIYWLFSSGKQGAFQALVYLHRYNESTLARMRAEYVIPLTAKMASRLEMLEQDANAASSAAARTKIRKQIETLRKKQTELLAFDENLRHFADMRITLDLDDGVKVNYGKFGDLLEGVKIVTGGGADD